MANWSSLPLDLVQSIADKLFAIEDYWAFTAVCRAFTSVRGNNSSSLPDVSRRPPWLLLSCPDEDRVGDDPPISDRGILSMYKNKKRFTMNLPEIRGKRCWGSPYGWIMTLGLDLQLHLFNPLNRRCILLSQLTCKIKSDDENRKAHWMRTRAIDRAILFKRPPSTFPDYDDFLVVATTMVGALMVMRPQTASWDTLHFAYVHDVASYDGQIYAVGNYGKTYLCSNIDGPDPPIAKEYVEADNVTFGATDKYYLVESDGELLLAVRLLEYDVERYKTYGIEVYSLNHQSRKWIEVEDLGDRSLFIGGGCQSISLSHPEAFNCRRNCIYFTDDNFDHFKGKGGHDIGIFDFDNGNMHTLYEGPNSLSVYSTPTWFIPTFT